MRVLSKIMPVCLLPMITLAVVGVAHARTPTPTPPPTSTPVAPKPAVFGGTAWVDGEISAGPVVAKIGDTACGTATFLAIPGAGYSYQVEVASDEATPGCGVDGATVSFFVAGRQAAQTAVWHSGSYQNVTLIAGPFFSTFGGVFTIDRLLTSERLTAFVGSTACGDYGDWLGGGPVYSYGICVFSNQVPGCGTEGAEVTFKLLDAEGSVIAVANEKGVWRVWDKDGEPPQRLNLTFGPPGVITMPGTGTGDGPQQAAPWGHLALALASLGLTGGIAALAVRRRALTR